MSVTTQSFEQAIRTSIQQHADAIREDCIKAAVAEFETRLRQAVGRAAIDLSNHFSVQRLGQDLVISVRVGEQRHE